MGDCIVRGWDGMHVQYRYLCAPNLQALSLILRSRLTHPLSLFFTTNSPELCTPSLPGEAMLARLSAWNSPVLSLFLVLLLPEFSGLSLDVSSSRKPSQIPCDPRAAPV